VAILTPISIARYALGAGWTRGDVTVAVAVAMAESGGNTDAHATRGEDSRGLWQINVAAHPDLASQNLYDPATNARAAYGIWRSQGWGPWSAHNNGSYLMFMPAAEAGMLTALALGPIGNAVESKVEGGANAAGGAVSQAAAIAQEPLSVLKFLEQPATWQRIAKIAIGGALVVGGLYLLTRVQVLEPVGAKVAGVVTGGGKLATAVKGAVK
jgi:hypothetical protein